jgi:acyl-homoserine lactone acylase PvdQ
MLKVETDTYSYPHLFLAEQLVAAAKMAPPKDARAKKLVEQARDWNGMADANSSVVSFLNATLYRALDLILEPHLGKDTYLYQWREVAFLQRVLTERPARWLPADYKNYDELLSAAADLGVKRLEEKTKDADPDDWPWKRFNYLDMLHPIGREGLLKKILSIGDSLESASRRQAPRTVGALCGQSRKLGRFHHVDHGGRIRAARERALPGPVSLLVRRQGHLRTVFRWRRGKGAPAQADAVARTLTKSIFHARAS